MLKKKQENKGITLVALVVTIVVLLILAGVTITALTGDNGILSQVARAKQENEKSGIIEEIRLDIATKQANNLGSINEDEFYEILSKYGVISDNETILTTIKGNYEILISDIYSGNIESSLVTTPLESWEYTLDENNKTIILNKYIGMDKKIIVPRIFKIKNIDYPVILCKTTGANENMTGPFANNSIIVIVKFDDNISIQSNNGFGLFYNCTNLNKVYNIPNSCIRLDYAFQACSALEYIDKLPENVEYLMRTFNGCLSLDSSPDIPINVYNMDYTYAGCINLNGIINIKSDNVSSANNCFLNAGTSNILINVNADSTTYETFNALIDAWGNVNFYNEQSLKIVCWGDSLTYGAGGNGTSYPSVLNTLCGDRAIVYNMGVGGETTSTIAGRQGGIPMVVDNFTIPSDTSQVEITIQGKDGSEVKPAMQKGNGLNNCFICDVEGVITYDSSKTKWFFNRNVSDSTVIVPNGTEIITDGMKNYNKSDILIIWTGTNDDPNVNQIQEIITKQEAMIQYNNSQKYVIIGLTNSDKDEVNNILAQHYGEHFLDIRSYLLTNGLTDAGISATDQDNLDLTNRKIPTSLRADSVHLNNFGYTIVGKQLYNKLISLGYLPN